MPKIVDKNAKSQDIARAALGVFRRVGYHHTRMTDIAQAAQVGKGTVYEYFANKADILRFLFDEYFTAFKKGALEAIGAAPTPAARLSALLTFALEHIAEWEEHCAVYVDYFGAARAGEERLVSLAEIYDEVGNLLHALIVAAQESGQIAEDVDPVATAELLVSVFDGVVLHGVFARRGCSRGALRDAALRLISRGLLDQPEATGDSAHDRSPVDP